jgi:hypothetical protein
MIDADLRQRRDRQAVVSDPFLVAVERYRADGRAV